MCNKCSVAEQSGLTARDGRATRLAKDAPLAWRGNVMIFGGFARAAAVLCIALALAGCGRRGALEPAPDASAPQAQPAPADADPLAAQLPRRKKVKKITPPARATPVDWLL